MSSLVNLLVVFSCEGTMVFCMQKNYLILKFYLINVKNYKYKIFI